MDSYNSQAGADEYIQFINSEDGLIEQTVLWDAISARLNRGSLPDEILMKSGPHLDAACGQGWLTAKLAEKFGQACGCDGSQYLIEFAKKHYPSGDFKMYDLGKPLPYADGQFQTVILNMAAHDLPDQPAAFKNLFNVLKPGGKFIITIANPYYAYPVGVWKRGIIGRLLSKKPALKVRPYNLMGKDFVWGTHIKPHFYPLSEQVNNALRVGFKLTYFEDLKVDKDSDKFNLNYQLYRFPYILLLEFEKIL
jgi:SAM-dependent methyltransferase